MTSNKKQKTFTLLEPLLSLALLSIILLGIMESQRFSLHTIQGSLKCLTVQERLRQLGILSIFSPHTFNASYNHWTSKNRTLLPKATSSIEASSSNTTVSLFWPAINPTWRCQSSPHPHISCLGE